MGVVVDQHSYLPHWSKNLSEPAGAPIPDAFPRRTSLQVAQLGEGAQNQPNYLQYTSP